MLKFRIVSGHVRLMKQEKRTKGKYFEQDNEDHFY